MKARFPIIFLGVFLIGAAGIAWAGGMNGTEAGNHSMEGTAGVSPPVMAPTEYLEYLEIENGLETGTLTAPGVHPVTPRHAGSMEKTADVSPPIMLSNDYLQYLEVEEGIETGSLTEPGLNPTEIAGPSTMVEIPEGG